jgi:hypothetical protein
MLFDGNHAISTSTSPRNYRVLGNNCHWRHLGHRSSNRMATEPQKLMPALHLILDGEGAWPDLAEAEAVVIHLADDAKVDLAGLARGMQSGKPSVAFRIDLPEDGHIVIWETSLALFLSAADAFKAKYGDPRD